MTQAQRFAALFGQEAVTSFPPSAVTEDHPEAALHLASAAAVLEDYGEQPSLVTETGEGFVVSGVQHAVFMGADGCVGVEKVGASDGPSDSAVEDVGHDQAEVDNWFASHEFPDNRTHVLAKNLMHDILQARSGGATDGVWMKELVQRTAGGKYASLRPYLNPGVLAYMKESAGVFGGEAGLDETMPRELKLDDFFFTERFPNNTVVISAQRALEKARQSTDTAMETAIAKKLYAIMPASLREYMHDGFKRMLQAESVLPPDFTRVVWEVDDDEHPTVHVLEGVQHRLLLTPVDGGLYDFTEDDVKWLSSGEAASEVYGLPAGVDYVYVRDDAAQVAAQALTELGYIPTLHRTLDEEVARVILCAQIAGGLTYSALLERLSGVVTSPAAVLDAQARVYALEDAGVLTVDGDGVLVLTDAAKMQLADVEIQALMPLHEAFAPEADLLARDLIRDIRSRADQDEDNARRLFRRVLEALRTHGRNSGYVDEDVEPLSEARTKKHYIAVANAIKTSKTVADLAAKLVRLYKAENPRFDAERFAKAAGINAVESVDNVSIEEMDAALVAALAEYPISDEARTFMAAFDEAKAAEDTVKSREAYDGILRALGVDERRRMTGAQIAKRGKAAKKLARDPKHQRELKARRKARARSPELKRKEKAYRRRVGASVEPADEPQVDEADIDRAAVKKAAMKAAATLFGEPDEKIVDSMVDNAITKKGAKDTEDAIQIVVSMMRSKGERVDDEAVEDVDSLDEIKRMTSAQIARRKKAAIKLARDPKHRRKLKAQRRMRKVKKAEFARKRKAYARRYRPRRTAASVEPTGTPEIVEVEFDILTLPAEAANYYAELCGEFGCEPAIEVREDGALVDLHAPGAVLDAVDALIFTEPTGTPAEEAADEAVDHATPAIAGALLALEGTLPAGDSSWGDVKTALTFLLGNGLADEAKVLVQGLQANDLTEFEADVASGGTVSGPYAFGAVTPRKAMNALAALNARITGQTEGLHTSHLQTILDTGAGRKVDQETFRAAVEGIEPSEDVRGADLTFCTYERDGEVIGQEVAMSGRDPVYLALLVPEGAVAGWDAVLEGKYKGAHPQRGQQPKPPVDVGADDAPKDVAEEDVTLVVSQGRLVEFLEAAKQAGASTEAPVRAEGTQVFVTLPESVSQRVSELFDGAVAVEAEAAFA